MHPRCKGRASRCLRAVPAPDVHAGVRTGWPGACRNLERRLEQALPTLHCQGHAQPTLQALQLVCAPGRPSSTTEQHMHVPGWAPEMPLRRRGRLQWAGMRAQSSGLPSEPVPTGLASGPGLSTGLGWESHSASSWAGMMPKEGRRATPPTAWEPAPSHMGRS